MSHTPDDNNLGGKTVKRLKSICRELGLTVGGKKSVLVERIRVARSTPAPDDDFASKTVKRLKAICRDRGLPVGGKKAVLVARLRATPARKPYTGERTAIHDLMIRPDVSEKNARGVADKLEGKLIAPHQTQGVAWMLSRELDKTASAQGGFLCDEMGVGKTIQTIATMLGNPVDHTLVVVPKSLLEQWKGELARFAPSLTVETYHGPGRDDKKNVGRYKKADVVLTTYGCMTPHKIDAKTVYLHGIVWDRVVADEGHEIRNPKSKIAQSMGRLTASSIKWVLTGTPVFNSDRDFASLCEFIGLDRVTANAKYDDVCAKYLRRRTLADVAKTSVPECEFKNEYIDLPAEELDLYRKVWTDATQTIKSIVASVDRAKFEMKILECILRCRQTLIHPQLYYTGVGEKVEKWTHGSHKLRTMCDMIEKHPDENALVFCQFTGEMDAVEEMIGRKCFRIDGSVSQKERQSRVDEFNRSTGAVFVIQIKAGGVGLNLQSASRIYLTAPSWAPATEMQAVGRAHRTGQTRKVVVRRMVYKSTPGLPSMEQSIVAMQERKSGICAHILNDPRLLERVPRTSEPELVKQPLMQTFDGRPPISGGVPDSMKLGVKQVKQLFGI